MKKLAMLLTMLPFVVLADVAPMSRGEWERHLQFERPISIDVPSTSPAGYALAVLMGVFLSVCVFALAKLCSHRRGSWRNYVSSAGMEWVILTALMVAACLCVESLFCPCSTFLNKVNEKTFEHNEQSIRLIGAMSAPHDETYEEYLFYERHCRTCGTALSYDHGRYCPKCNPRRDNKKFRDNHAAGLQP